jgi:hypothetical protein
MHSVFNPRYFLFYVIITCAAILSPYKAHAEDVKQSPSKSLKTYDMQCNGSWHNCQVSFEDGLLITEFLEPKKGDRRQNSFGLYTVSPYIRTSKGAMLPLLFTNISNIKASSCMQGVDTYSVFAGSVGDCSEVEAIIRIDISPNSLMTTKFNPNSTSRLRGGGLMLILPKGSQSDSFVSDFSQFLEDGKAALKRSAGSSPGF